MDDARSRTEDLYRRYGGQVLRRCRFLLGGDDAARDAMQEVFVKVLLHQGSFRADGSMLGWTLRIATNHCLNELRARRAPWHQAFRTYVETTRTAGGAETPEVAQLVRALLGRFDLETQAVAVHHFVDEMSKEEVARTVGLSVPTVRKRLRAFLDGSRSFLEQEGLPWAGTLAEREGA